MNRTITRRITAAIAGPVAAAGIFLGSMSLGSVAPAFAEPANPTACSSMAMPDNQASAPGPNPLTRAGQVGAASTPASSAGTMYMGCPAVGHG
jgi:hypothetical protein